MSAKYNFSVNRYNRLKQVSEELQVINCDSFDEARRIVEKAVADRELFEAEELRKIMPGSASKSGGLSTMPAGQGPFPGQPLPTYNGGDDNPPPGTPAGGDKLQNSDNEPQGQHQ